jgi:hypothetical protein
VKLLLKTFKILCGITFLVVGIGGVVGLCFSSPTAFKQMVVYRTPVRCPVHGNEVEVPGRLVAGIVIGVPIGALLGAWWVFSSVFASRHERDF